MNKYLRDVHIAIIAKGFTETAVAVLGTVCIWLYGFNFRGIVYGVVACVLTEIFLMDLNIITK